MSTKTTEKEPDWKAIAVALWHKVSFAVANFELKGPGVVIDTKTFEMRHWKDDFADALELMPGVKVDRDKLHEEKPKKRRKKGA